LAKWTYFRDLLLSSPIALIFGNGRTDGVTLFKVFDNDTIYYTYVFGFLGLFMIYVPFILVFIKALTLFSKSGSASSLAAVLLCISAFSAGLSIAFLSDIKLLALVLLVLPVLLTENNPRSSQNILPT
jgi:hypothetical protein